MIGKVIYSWLLFMEAADVTAVRITCPCMVSAVSCRNDRYNRNHLKSINEETSLQGIRWKSAAHILKKEPQFKPFNPRKWAINIVGCAPMLQLRKGWGFSRFSFLNNLKARGGKVGITSSGLWRKYTATNRSTNWPPASYYVYWYMLHYISYSLKILIQVHSFALWKLYTVL